ncbi:MAG: A/G-specific adenine glycosylase [Bacteroidaceae bacterium]|nr:A/G-specific adenine glycosylase [Bacteroidaceae bacterium]
MSEFADKLIGWYEENKRDLPWRDTKDPYRIWISEIILQQTRVAQGYDYFVRFMERFPDVFTLAEADEDEVMKYWQGLGYYSRARNLHAAARSMASLGGFPTTYEGVLALKGVGEYTAAAICSFAYDMPYAVVDGNVYRVLSRWLGIDTPIDSTSGKKEFAQAAQELMDKRRPALYNQAIMDFGALQCTPASPDCLFCPLADSCLALAQGRVDALPVKQHKTKVTHRFFNYIYVRTGGYTFIRKRTGNDIWKNLYEPLLIETDTDFSENEAAFEQKLLDVLGETPKCFLKPVKMGVKHVLSHRVIHANFYELHLPDDFGSLEGYQKVPEEDLHKFAVSNLVYHFFSLILDPNNQNNVKHVSK